MKNNYITNENIPEVDLMRVTISKISGKSAGPNTHSTLVVSTVKYKNSPGLSEDEGATAITFDGACNGMVSPYTFGDNIKNGYLITPTTFMPNGMDLAEITDRWKQSTAFMSGGIIAT